MEAIQGLQHRDERAAQQLRRLDESTAQQLRPDDELNEQLKNEITSLRQQTGSELQTQHQQKLQLRNKSTRLPEEGSRLRESTPSAVMLAEETDKASDLR